MKRRISHAMRRAKTMVFESQYRLTKRHRRIALTGVGAILCIVVLVQLLYPGDRTLPFTRLGETDAGGLTVAALQQRLDELEQTTELEVYGHGRSLMKERASELGVTIDRARVQQQATHYPWWLRIIPTSLLWSAPRVTQVPGSVDVAKAEVYIAAHTAVLDALPVNAQLAVEGESVVIRPSKKGAQLPADALKAGLVRGSYTLGGVTRLDVAFDSREPVIGEAALEAVQRTAQAAIDKEMALQYGDRSVVVPREVRASWLVIRQEQATKADEVSLGVDAGRSAEYASAQFQQQVVRPAGVTQSYLTDGIEQRRIEGAKGQTVDGEALARGVHEHFFGSASQPVMVPVKPVPPQVKKHHTFTKSQAGLAAYVQSLADEGDIRVSIRQLDGAKWQAEYRGSEQTIAASTYKVYVVAYTLDQISHGKLSYDDPVRGTTVRTCLERTIVQSDNACPEALLERFTARSVIDFLRQRGYSSGTIFTREHAMTTAHDLTQAMAEITAGKLVRGQEQRFLMELMGRVQHRQGVPAGTGAPRVFNKVGFLNGYLHDAAIVQHRQGTYVIAVMTRGLTWNKIAEITKRAEGIMYE